MTVCVAAIFGNGTKEAGVAFAADQRVTDSDSSLIYSSTFMKWQQLSDSVVVLIAGDMALVAEAINKTERSIKTRTRQDSLSVEEVVGYYTTAYHEKLEEYFERKILSHYCLTADEFHQKPLTETLTKLILSDLKTTIPPYEAEIIIAGNDDEGAKIWVVDADGYSTDQTARGYAAIGEGGSTAERQFKLRHYFPSDSSMEVLFLCYLAKRRAEVIGSVGPETDTGMTMRGICGGFRDASRNSILEAEYSELEKRMFEYEEESRKRLSQWKLTTPGKSENSAE